MKCSPHTLSTGLAWYIPNLQEGWCSLHNDGKGDYTEEKNRNKANYVVVMLMLPLFIGFSNFLYGRKIQVGNKLSFYCI